MQKILRHPIVRKSLLLAALACAGLLVGEIYQRHAAPSAEETLQGLGATRTMTQTLSVNDVSITAEVWALPAFASPAALSKSKGKTLTVGRTVFLFDDDSVLPQRGICTYPEDLPAFGLNCGYVIDTGAVRLIEGSFPASPEDIGQILNAAATGDGWQTVAPGVWQRGETTLVLQARPSDSPDIGTRVVLAVQKQRIQ